MPKAVNAPVIVNREDHQARYAAMLNSAVAITDTQYEGGSNLDAAQYYEYLLKLEIPDLPFKLNLPKDVTDAIQQKITNLKTNEKYLLEAAKKQTLFTDLDLKVIVRLLNKQCDTADDNSTYFPGGYTGKKSGHFSPLKFRKLPNGNFAISVLNHGDGQRYHPQVAVSGAKKKPSYQSFEYEFDLNTDAGRENLANLIKLSFDPNSKGVESGYVKAYDADDLYAILKFNGKQLPVDEESLKQKAVTPQRAGSCTITNMHAIARDVLVSKGYDRKTRKQYHFAIKLKSVIDQYYQWKEGKCPTDVFESSLRELSVRLNKLYRNVLTEEEYIDCSNLHNFFKDAVKATRADELRVKSLPEPIPAFTAAYEDKALNTSRLQTVQEAYGIETLNLRLITALKYDVTPENIQSILSMDMYSLRENAYKVLNLLPHCTGKPDDPFWSRVPPTHIPEIIHRLMLIILDLKAGKNKPAHERSMCATIAFLAYDIAAQLAPRYTKPHWGSAKLEPGFALGLDDTYSEQSFFTNPVDYHTIKRIANNFRERSQGRKRVFTNNAEGGEYDSTIEYVIKVLLDDPQRDAIIQHMEENGLGKKSYSDADLFGHLMTNLSLTYFDEESNKFIQILDQTIINILCISASAHALGQYTATYKKTNLEKPHFHFHQSRHTLDLMRSEKKDDAAARHCLPTAEKSATTLHQDFSESVIFHPTEDKTSLQKQFRTYDPKGIHFVDTEYHYSPKLVLQPYQFFMAGDNQSDSDIWPVSKNQLEILQSVDEELRQITCSPNLQISRILTWLSSNLDKLQFEVVRNRVLSLIFEYEKLDKALINQPQLTRYQIGKCLHALYEYCDNKNMSREIKMWAADLVYHFRYYLEVSDKLYEQKYKTELPDFRNLLLNEFKNVNDATDAALLANQIIREARNSGQNSISFYCQLLICRIKAHIGDQADLSTAMWQQIEPALIQAIENDPSNALIEINKLLPSYIKNIGKVEHVVRKGDHLFLMGAHFKINLSSGRLILPGQSASIDCSRKVLTGNNQDFLKKIKFDLSSSDFLINRDLSSNTQANTIQTISRKWEFGYEKEESRSGEQTYKLTSAKQKIIIESEEFQFAYVKDFHTSLLINPFEIQGHFQKYYQYWVNYPGCLVMENDSDMAYFYTDPDKPIHQLKKQLDGSWQQTNHIFLNMNGGKSDLEKVWQKRLQPIFGLSDLRVIAEKAPNQEIVIKSIKHLLTNLSFSADSNSQKLKSDQFNEFYLSNDKSLSQLNGMAEVVILENDQGVKKIILPAFKLMSSEKNNALNSKAISDKNTLCNEGHPYYTYALDNQNELETDSFAGNLYLALIYRSQGDFERAFKYLKRCHSLKNITQESVDIIMQVMNRKMISPMGAAFDLKLNHLLETHMKKWSKNKKRQFEDIRYVKDNWKAHIDTQYKLWMNSNSIYKDESNILFKEARLTKNELQGFGEYSPTMSERFGKVSKLDEDLISYSRLGFQSDYAFNNWLKKFNNLPKNLNVPSSFEELRIYSPENRYVGLSFLLAHYQRLFQAAISQDQEKTNKLNYELFKILQNDENPETMLYGLISPLLYVRDNPLLFQNIQDSLSGVELIKEIGKIIAEQRNTSKVFLEIMSLPKAKELITEASASNDFQPKPMVFSVNTIQHEKDINQPLKSIYDQFFTNEKVPVATTDFALTEAGLGENPRLLEKTILANYAEGHKQNKTKERPQHTLNDGSTLLTLDNKLAQQKESDLKNQKKLLANILTQLNAITDENLAATKEELAQIKRLIMAREAGEKRLLNLDDITNAFLDQNPALLLKQNSFLDQTTLTTIFTMFTDYAFLGTRIKQVDEAREKIAAYDANARPEDRAYNLQLIANTIYKERTYDIRRYPEFLVYEQATGRMLRDDQAKILDKIITLLESPTASNHDMHHALLQFAAGGGKTSVLIPILAHRFARKGFLPVIFNTTELYKTGLKDIPKNLQQSFQQNIEVIDRELDHVWTKEDLQRLLRDLRRWQSEGKCLLMKPVTWHGINIAYKESIQDSHKKDLSKAAKDVLDFFKYQSIKLEDECHLTSDAMQQSIKTHGTKQKIPANQLELLMTFYQSLMGISEDSQPIAGLAGIVNQSKRNITPQELDNLQDALAKMIVQSDLFKNLPENVTSDMVQAYLLQADKKRPEWLKSLYFEKKNKWKIVKHPNEHKPLAELIILARAFIKTHLPHILTLQYKKDYGTSIHKNDLTCAPKHESKDVTSHFGDHTLVTALTIQLYHQQGLLADHVKILIDYLKKSHEKEREWNKNLSRPTQAEVLLLKVIPLSYPFYNMQNMTDELLAQLSQDEAFCKNPTLIEYFLTYFALPQINVPSERYTSTAADLQAGFQRSLLLSATPGLRQTYPPHLKPENCFLEEAFEAEVIDTLLKPQNRRAVINLENTKTPAEFFAKIPQEVLADMTTLIDRGALLTNFDPKSIAEAYLNIIDKKTATKTAAYLSKKKTHLRSKTEGIADKDISGTALVEELKRQGIKPEAFLLFLFLDLSKTTGIDIKRPHSDHAGLTVGKGQTMTDTIQAAMRERQLLDKDAQSVTWLMFQSLYNEINPKANKLFDPTQVLYWLIKNEATVTEGKILNCAYQSIYRALLQVIWDAGEQDPENIYAYSLWMREYQSISPIHIYELDSSADETEKVLNAYKEAVLERLKLGPYGKRFYTDPKYILGIPPHVEKQINTIINNTKKLIETMQTPPKQQLQSEVQQEMNMEIKDTPVKEEEKETQIKNRNDTASNFKFMMETYHAKSDNLRVIFDPPEGDKHYQNLNLITSENISMPSLKICQKHFAVLENDSNPNNDPIEQLKPIKILLMRIKGDSTLDFAALTAAGAEYYSFEMNASQFGENDSAYAMITCDGKILQTSNNISLEKCQTVTETLECQKMCAYTNFLNGQVSNPRFLSQVVAEHKWDKPTYDKLVEKIKEVRVTSNPVTLNNNKLLNMLCGWEKKQSTPSDHAALRRYRSPVQEQNKVVPKVKLESLTVLPNGMQTSTIPIATPETSLSGYLLGEKMDPTRSKRPEQIQLSLLLGKIQAIPSDNEMSFKAEIKQHLIDDCLKAGSHLSDPTKLKQVEEAYSNFTQLDNLLDNIYTTLKKFDSTDTQEETHGLNFASITAINKAYMRSQTQPIPECLDILKETLSAIATEAIKKRPQVKQSSSLSYFTMFSAPATNTPPPLTAELNKSVEKIDRFLIQITNRSTR